MITRDCPFCFVFRKRQAHYKTRWDAQRPGLSNKKRVKVSAVSLSHITRINSIAAAPAGSGLVIADGIDNVVVEKTRLPERVLNVAGDLFCLLGNPAVYGNTSIRHPYVAHAVFSCFYCTAHLWN